MRIQGVEAVTAGLSLVSRVRSAGLTHSDKTTLFVRLVTDAGSGWGECAAYPDARPPDPTVEAVEGLVLERVVGRLFEACEGGSLVNGRAVRDACRRGDSVAEQSVIAALEMAVLDVELRCAGRSLRSHVGATRRQVETGALVGIPAHREIEILLGAVAEVVAAGARRVRLKIEPGWEHAPLRAVRDHFPNLVLQADANGSFDPDSADELAGLDAYRLRCLEQPFALGELLAHRSLSEAMSTPIALDESLWSPARVEEAVAAGACRVACLKPGRLGGVFATLEAARTCADAGVDCFIGGFFESGLGRSLNAALAGRPEFTLPGDLGDPAGYLQPNPFTSLSSRDGLVTLSDVAGIGAEPLAAVLAACTLRSRWFGFAS